MWNWLKHAFAVEPPGPAAPDPAQAAVIERLLREVVRREMSTPALLFLESVRPLNGIAAYAMHFFEPIVRAVADTRGARAFADFLERRGSIDYLVQALERLSAENDGGGGGRPPVNAPPPD